MWMLRREGDNPILLVRHASFCFGSWESHILGWERCHPVSLGMKIPTNELGRRGCGWKGVTLPLPLPPGPLPPPPSPLGSLSPSMMKSLCVCIHRHRVVDKADSPCGGLAGGCNAGLTLVKRGSFVGVPASAECWESVATCHRPTSTHPPGWRWRCAAAAAAAPTHLM